MNLEETRKVWKDAIDRKFTIEEVVEIMGPLGLPAEMIASIASLVCEEEEKQNL